MKFYATFNARNIGAIGITYPNTYTVEADTPEAARLALYEKWEHISHLKLTEIPEGNLYDALVAAGVPVDHHESDLYFQDSAESRAILATYPQYRAGSFSNAKPPYVGQLWREVPFAYSPYWEAKAAQAK